MIISIIGGGNIGTLMAAEFAAKGHNVRLFTSNPSSWSHTLEALNPDGTVFMSGELELVTASLEDSVYEADMIWITYPTFLLADIASRLLPLVSPGQQIGVVPGNDAEFFFAEHVRKGAILFGLQRVHSIARLKEYGKSSYMLGRKPELQVAALPSAETDNVRQRVEELFDIPSISLPSYLVETLTPSNPILHTSRIRTMFASWNPEVSYDHNIFFYREWDDASSELMLKCDDELQDVCRVLERELDVDLSQVRSLRDHYESPTAQAMTKKISGIPAFQTLTSPMREEKPGVWVPDFSSRYFRADFAYGLKAIKDIAKLTGVATPGMDDVYGWYIELSGNTDVFNGAPATIEELASIYA